MTRKLYNPKSQAPAAYIPCWLIQIPSSLLSHAAKILYGRLAQWSNERGKVYRSVPQLAEEIGASRSAIDRHLRELKDAKLIGTYHPQAGGINHFEFYDHEWMRDPINKHLVYNSSEVDPTSKLTLPHVKIDVTPTSKLTCINIKEIKRNKKTTTTRNQTAKTTQPDTTIQDTCSSSFIFSKSMDTKLLKLREKFIPLDNRTEEEFLKQVYFHVGLRDPQKHTLAQGIKGVEKIIKGGSFETPARYKCTKAAIKKLVAEDDNALLADYRAWLNDHQGRMSLETWMPDSKKRDRAIYLYDQEQKFFKSRLQAFVDKNGNLPSTKVTKKLDRSTIERFRP